MHTDIIRGEIPHRSVRSIGWAIRRDYVYRGTGEDQYWETAEWTASVIADRDRARRHRGQGRLRLDDLTNDELRDRAATRARPGATPNELAAVRQRRAKARRVLEDRGIVP
jgi:hypothetical protein